MHSRLPFAAPLLLAALAIAQQPETVPDQTLPDGAGLGVARVPLHTADADGGVAYGLWAAGRDYKASFDAGMTFVPYLGADYPHNQPWSWRTTSARVGEQELATAAPTLTHGDYRAEYDLGGLVEAYDVRDDGLEQTFVLTQRPTASGDLVIRGAIDSALRADRVGPAQQDLVFRDAQGTVLLRYGKAVAIDARGRRAAVTTTAADAEISLRLDGAWLATATFPVVVDPLLSTFAIQSGAPLNGMDLVREPALNAGNLWLATTRWASATDRDLVMTRYDDNGANPVVNFSDITNSWSAFEPSMGIHFTSGKTLLAYTRDSFTGTRRLRGHLHSRNDNLLQTTVFNIGDLTINASRPDVASDLHPIGQNALVVVYQAEGTGFPWVNLPNSSVMGVAVDLTGTGTAGTPFVIASDLAQDCERPQIGKVQLGSFQEWNVVYQAIDSGLTPGGALPTWAVQARRVDRNGNVSAPYNVVRNLTYHNMSPQIAGYNSTAIVIATRASVASAGPRPDDTNGSTVWADRIEWTGASFSNPGGRHLLEAANDNRILLNGFDADRTTASHYCYSYRSTVTENVYLGVLGYRGAELLDALVWQQVGSEYSGAGAVAYDEDAGNFVIAYERTVPAGTSQARMVRYAHPGAPAPSLGGLGCSSAQIVWEGDQLIGSEFNAIALQGLDPGALATVAVTTATFAQPLLGVPGVNNGCWLLVPNTGPDLLAFLPFGFGPQVRWQLPLPEWLGPMTLHFQGFHFDGALTSVSTTQRLSVPLVK